MIPAVHLRTFDPKFNSLFFCCIKHAAKISHQIIFILLSSYCIKYCKVKYLHILPYVVFAVTLYQGTSHLDIRRRSWLASQTCRLNRGWWLNGHFLVKFAPAVPPAKQVLFQKNFHLHSLSLPFKLPPPSSNSNQFS